jgi:hypothetical protein
LTVDDDQLQKAQGTDHFDHNFGGFDRSAKQNAEFHAGNGAGLGQEGSVFGPILLLFVNCPLGQKRKPCRLAVLKGGEGGRGMGRDETKILSENLR